jgi:hypothetical protein
MRAMPLVLTFSPHVLRDIRPADGQTPQLRDLPSPTLVQQSQRHFVSSALATSW